MTPPTIDGAFKTTVYSPSVLHRQVVYSNLALTEAVHSLRIVVKGEKNASATNTFVDVDEIEVVNSGAEGIKGQQRASSLAQHSG